MLLVSDAHGCPFPAIHSFRVFTHPKYAGKKRPDRWRAISSKLAFLLVVRGRIKPEAIRGFSSPFSRSPLTSVTEDGNGSHRSDRSKKFQLTDDGGDDGYRRIGDRNGDRDPSPANRVVSMALFIKSSYGFYGKQTRLNISLHQVDFIFFYVGKV